MLSEKELKKYAGSMIKKLRNKRGITQEELAERLHTTRQAVSKYENGDRGVNQNLLFKLADIFEVTIDYFFPTVENAKIIELPKNTIKIPVLGIIPAGVPIEAIENILRYVEIPEEWTRGNMEYFGLEIDGNSMLPEYKDKDTIIVLKQDYCESGQDCVVIVNGNSAVFKRVIKQGDNIILKPLNNEYEPVMYTKEDIEKLPIRILGVAKEVRRKL